jgi:hypothetical protein
MQSQTLWIEKMEVTDACGGASGSSCGGGLLFRNNAVVGQVGSGRFQLCSR